MARPVRVQDESQSRVEGVIMLNIYLQSVGLSPGWGIQLPACEAGPHPESPHLQTSSLEEESPGLPKITTAA